MTEEEIEGLGLALAKQKVSLKELKAVFGLSDEDLEIDIGPLDRLE